MNAGIIVFAVSILGLSANAHAADAGVPPTREEFATLKAEVEQLKALLPTQAHTMVDVEHQFANLWFAGREKNWPLATFYLNETRNRIAWTLRIRPVRKLANGADIALAPFAQSLDDLGFVPLRSAIDKHDPKAFEASYRIALGACYSCHVAVEKPALKPELPRTPGALLIRMKVAGE
jgi:hypothetical protein